MRFVKLNRQMPNKEWKRGKSMYDGGRIGQKLINQDLAVAINGLAVAENRFNMASGAEEVDAAILDLEAAELHLRATLKRARIATVSNAGDAKHNGLLVTALKPAAQPFINQGR